jgi:hypothetical protein
MKPIPDHVIQAALDAYLDNVGPALSSMRVAAGIIVDAMDAPQKPCLWSPDYEEGGWLTGCHKRTPTLWPNEEDEPGAEGCFCHGCGRSIAVAGDAE